MFESADHEPSWDRLHTAGAVTEPRRVRPAVRAAGAYLLVSVPLLCLIGRYLVQWVWGV